MGTVSSLSHEWVFGKIGWSHLFLITVVKYGFSLISVFQVVISTDRALVALALL